MTKKVYNEVCVCLHCDEFACLTEQGLRNHNKRTHGNNGAKVGVDYDLRPLEEYRHLLSKKSLGQSKRAYHFSGKYTKKDKGKQVITPDTKSILVPCLLEIPINFGQVRFIQNGS
jgi:hypothetical protein